MRFNHFLSTLFGSRDSRRQQPRLSKKRSRRLILEPLEDRRVLATFLVTNIDDSGPGSLRQAMLDADRAVNQGSLPDEIHFNISGAGVQTLHPAHSLPAINEAVIIDGYTQPGASPNNLPVGNNAVLMIEIDCSAVPVEAPLFGDLFGFVGDGSTVRGLIINHESQYAFGFQQEFGPNNTTIAGNFIGTDSTGMEYRSGGNNGIRLRGSGNHIGGLAPADRNVITGPGSGAQMIILQNGSGNFIQGNYIGINAAGTAPLQPPGIGSIPISIGNGSSNNTIGGTEPGAGNVILGTNIGIGLFEGNTGSNVVQGNFIGTNAAGTAGLGGGIGIFVNGPSGASDTIGGSGSGAGNLVSGNTFGIQLSNRSPGTTVWGNKIGTDADGTSAVPNSAGGIVIAGPGGATIGGTQPGEGNTIAFNGGAGVFVGQGSGWSLSGNSIFANGERGIRLFFNSNNTQTVNDPGDADTGPNGLQNYPVIAFAASTRGHTVIGGTLNSTPNRQFRVEFFASDVADPSGFGEGQTFLGFTSVTTDASGDAAFTVRLPGAASIGQIVSATATAPDGSTSEFSQNVPATNLDVIIDATTPQSFLDSLTVVHGSLILVGVAGRTDLLLPNLTEVDGDFIVTGNPDLTTLSVPQLAKVLGDVEVSDNPALTDVNLSSVITVGGNVSVNNNTAAMGVDVSSLTTVAGNVDINGNTAATGIDVGSLITVTGNVDINGNTSATGVDVGSLSTVGGDLNFSGNTSLGVADLGSLNNVGGSISVAGNTVSTNIDLGELNNVGGSISVAGNTVSTNIDLGELNNVGGSITVAGNTVSTNIDLSELNTVGGSITVASNTISTNIDLSTLTFVGGSVSVNGNTSATGVDLGSVTSVGGSISVDGNTAATGIDLGCVTTVTGNLSVTGNTAATGVNLSCVTSVSGNLSVNGNTAATGVDLASVTSVGGSISVSGNTAATGVDLSSVASVGGDLTASDNTSMTGLSLGQATSVGGSMRFSGNTSLPSLLLPKLLHVGGDFTFIVHPALTMLDVPNLTTVGGNTDVSQNQGLLTVDLSAVTTVGRSISVNGNTAATDIDLSGLSSIVGSVNVNGNTAATDIDLSAMTSVGGSININNNEAATEIDVSGLASVDGSINVNNNEAATEIDLSGLTSVDGSININGNQAATEIDVSGLTSVDGSININNNEAATEIDLSSLSTVGGDLTVETKKSVTAVTAAGSTEVTLLSAEAQMTAALASGTFDHAVAFTVIRLDPSTLPPQPGLDSTGLTATIDPLAAYQFDFDIPTLGQDAALTFEINVHMLLPADRDAFLTALAAGNVTVAVKNETPESVYQAFAICDAPMDDSSGSPCVAITRLDNEGNSLPAGSTDTPATVRFDGVTGHFSTFAVVIVTPSGPTGNSPPVARDDTVVLSSGNSVTINVLANDSDANGDTLTVTSVTQPASGHGAVTINADGTLTYMQTVLASGAETFTYTIGDGHGGTATATVTVTVNLSAKTGIDMLLAQVKSSSLRHGQQTSLIAKLNAAQKSLTKGNARAAANQLTAFANEVRALKRSHILAADLADLWLFEVNNILASMPRAAIKNQPTTRCIPTRGV